jgi:CP family cyanate transporter-like MFS transporter
MEEGTGSQGMTTMRLVQGASARSLLLGVVAIVGLNLRPFLTAIGPLTGRVSEATGLDYRSMALLTLVPMLLMGLFAFWGPFLQRTLGARLAVIGGLAVLVVGSALRLVTSDGAALIGTAALCGLGVAVVQAVFPGIIKEQFPNRTAVVMGLYSSMLMGGGAAGAQLSPIVADAFGSWRAGLAWIALPAALAVAATVVLPKDRKREASTSGAAALLRRPRTWLLMACFGLVNGGYSSVVAWFAPHYQTLGWTSAASGSLLAVMAVSQAVAALSLPVLAARGEDRRSWLWVTLLMQMVGFGGLAVWPQFSPVAWAVLVGAGLGGCFALSMVVALDHLRDPREAGALSALMQGGGFVIAAIPPWIVAALHDRTGGFAAGWLFHLGCVVIVAALVVRFVPSGYARAMSAPALRRHRLVGDAMPSKG